MVPIEICALPSNDLIAKFSSFHPCIKPWWSEISNMLLLLISLGFQSHFFPRTTSFISSFRAFKRKSCTYRKRFDWKVNHLDPSIKILIVQKVSKFFSLCFISMFKLSITTCLISSMNVVTDCFTPITENCREKSIDLIFPSIRAVMKTPESAIKINVSRYSKSSLSLTTSWITPSRFKPRNIHLCLKIRLKNHSLILGSEFRY